MGWKPGEVDEHRQWKIGKDAAAGALAVFGLDLNQPAFGAQAFGQLLRFGLGSSVQGIAYWASAFSVSRAGLASTSEWSPMLTEPWTLWR